MKRFITAILVLSLVLLVVSCAGGQETPLDSGTGGNIGEPVLPATSGEKQPDPPSVPEYTTYQLNSSAEQVHLLGVRSLTSDEQINCDWSCSGIELKIDNKGGDIGFAVSTQNNKPAYFRIWLDGKEWKQSNGDPYYRISGAGGSIIMRAVPAGAHNLRVMKVTGYTLAQAQIFSVSLNGSLLPWEGETAEYYIEFVGDSITCGWGTIGQHGGAYTDQDGTLAYPYLLVQALGADYSMTALSGQGLCYGTPGVANGYLYDSPLRDDRNQSDFARKADLVVINVGTNDYAHREEIGQAAESYRQVYLEFLQIVREKNGPDCKILCLYNTMNDTFAVSIIAACRDMGGEAAGVFTYEMARTENNGHPTIAEHAAYAEVLEPLVKQILAFRGSGLTLQPTGDGDIDRFDFATAKEQ